MERVITAIYKYIYQCQENYIIVDVRALKANPCSEGGRVTYSGHLTDFFTKIHNHMSSEGMPESTSYGGTHFVRHKVLVVETPEDVKQLTEPEVDKGAKYRKLIRDRRNGNSIEVDVYDVLEAYGVTCPSLAHALKKLLLPGQRGSKDFEKDMREGANSIEQAILLQKWRVDDEQT